MEEKKFEAFKKYLELVFREYFSERISSFKLFREKLELYKISFTDILQFGRRLSMSY